MIDHHDRPDEIHPTPANDQASPDARDGAEVQQAQDEAGIAGEPQPTDPEPTDGQSNEELDQEPTSPPGYGGA